MTPMIEPDTGFFDPEACDLSMFEALIDQTTDLVSLPHAAEVQHNVPIYDVAALRDALNVKGTRRQIMAEWAHVLKSGAGIIVLRGAYADTAVLDDATAVYERIIAAEKRQMAAVVITLPRRDRMTAFGIPCKSFAKQHQRCSCTILPIRPSQQHLRHGWDQTIR